MTMQGHEILTLIFIALACVYLLVLFVTFFLYPRKTNDTDWDGGDPGPYLRKNKDDR